MSTTAASGSTNTSRAAAGGDLPQSTMIMKHLSALAKTNRLLLQHLDPHFTDDERGLVEEYALSLRTFVVGVDALAFMGTGDAGGQPARGGRGNGRRGGRGRGRGRAAPPTPAPAPIASSSSRGRGRGRGHAPNENISEVVQSSLLLASTTNDMLQSQQHLIAEYLYQFHLEGREQSDNPSRNRTQHTKRKQRPIQKYGKIVFSEEVVYFLIQSQGELSEKFGLMMTVLGKTSRARTPPPGYNQVDPLIDTSAANQESAIDAIEVAFYRSPFQVSLTDIATLRIPASVSSTGWAERHAVALWAVGKKWVDNRLLQGKTLSKLEEINAELIQRLGSMVEGDEEAKKELWKAGLGRGKKDVVSIALCGMVKAGKSLFLNALIGQNILPSNELPATAWPCLIRHTPGQRTPKLVLDINTLEALNYALDRLRHLRYGEVLRAYEQTQKAKRSGRQTSHFGDSSEFGLGQEYDMFAGILDDDGDKEGGGKGTEEDLMNSSEGNLRYLHRQWVDLHKMTKANLTRFEDMDDVFVLKSEAEGREAVVKLLAEINDIVRLCHRFGIKIPIEERDRAELQQWQLQKEQEVALNGSGHTKSGSKSRSSTSRRDSSGISGHGRGPSRSSTMGSGRAGGKSWAAVAAANGNGKGKQKETDYSRVRDQDDDELPTPPPGQVSWPLLRVEFEALKSLEVEGVFEFIDLPGIGESFSTSTSAQTPRPGEQNGKAKGGGDNYFPIQSTTIPPLEMFDSFSQIIRLVSEYATSIVPIVSLIEVPKSDWKRLPDIIANGSAGMKRAEVVVCTHLDKISGDNLTEQLTSVSKTFWPSTPNAIDRVLPCSSLFGMSASRLLQDSKNGKPRFEDIMKKTEVGYQCALRILGDSDHAKSNYESFSHESWVNSVNRQKESSRLFQTMSRLVNDMVIMSKQRMLLFEGEVLRRTVHMLILNQRRTLIDMYRTQEEHIVAREAFLKAKIYFQEVLKDWAGREKDIKNMTNKDLKRYCEALGASAVQALQIAMDTAAKEKPPHPPKVSPNKTVKAISPPEIQGNNLMYGHPFHAEFFLFTAQSLLRASLSTLREQYVSQIRKMGARAQEGYFEVMKSVAEEMPVPNLDLDVEDGEDGGGGGKYGEVEEPDGTRRKVKSDSVLKDDILEELNVRWMDTLPTDPGRNGISFGEYRTEMIKDVMRKQNVRYTPSEAYTAIMGAIAKPLLSAPSQPRRSASSGSIADKEERDRLKLKDVEEGEEVVEEERVENEIARKKFGDLGFMLRAPIAVVAVVPWVLGAGVWPFLIREKKYILDRTKITTQFLNIAVQPFVNDLKAEGEQTAIGVMRKCSASVREAVKIALDREERRYISHRVGTKVGGGGQDGNGGMGGIDGGGARGGNHALHLARITNYIAAEAALVHLQKLLKAICEQTSFNAGG